MMKKITVSWQLPLEYTVHVTIWSCEMHFHSFVKKNLDSVYFKIRFNYEILSVIFRVRGQYTIFLHSLPENLNYPLARESCHLLAVVHNNIFLRGSTPWKRIF